METAQIADVSEVVGPSGLCSIDLKHRPHHIARRTLTRTGQASSIFQAYSHCSKGGMRAPNVMGHFQPNGFAQFLLRTSSHLDRKQLSGERLISERS